MSTVKIAIESDMMRVIFPIEDKSLNFQHRLLVKSKNVKSVYYGTHTRSFLGPRIWHTEPSGFQTQFHYDFSNKK